MKKGLILILSTILLSCSHSNWTKDEQTKFVQECREEGGSKNYCECFMENVMENYHIAEDANTIDFETKIELSKDCE